MQFRGWQATSLIEYPGRVSTVLFCGGCNFRCPFCHNAELVLDPRRLPMVEGEQVLAYLASCRSLYQAVVVTGGEPLLQDGLPAFLAAAHGLGLLCGLETNGSLPDRLAGLLSAGLLDWVGMDVKAPLTVEAYSRAAGVPAGPAPDGPAGWLAGVERSIELLLGASIEVEFRTTVVGGLHRPEDIRAIGRRLRGARRYVLQRYQPGRTLERSLRAGEGKRPLVLRETLRALQAELTGLVGSCELRNL